MKKENISKVPTKDLEIELAVIKIFLAVLKRRKLYHAFRVLLPFKNNSNKVFHVPKAAISPFKECNGLVEVANKLVSLTKEVGLSTNVNEMDKYDRVTANINHLLHFSVEHILPMDELSKIGQEVFDMSCFVLFGDEISDEVPSEPQAIEMPHNSNDVGIALGGEDSGQGEHSVGDILRGYSPGDADWLSSFLVTTSQTIGNGTPF